MASEEQRYRPRPPRIPLRCAVRFHGAGFDGTGTVVDLSAHGVKIVSTTPPVKWGDISLSVSLPGVPKPLVIPDGIVRWTSGNSFGVTFPDLSHVSRDTLQAVLDAYAQHPQPPQARTVSTMVHGSVQRTRWLTAVILGSVLAASLALGVVYYGRAFYKYGPDYYEPKDEERLIHELKQEQIKRVKRDEVIVPK